MKDKMPNEEIIKELHLQFPWLTSLLSTNLKGQPVDRLENFIIEKLEAKDAEWLEKISKIELAPSDEDIEKVESCKSLGEGFGFGQIWMLNKIKNLTNKG